MKIKQHRPLQGTVKTCTIIVKNGKWYACFSCEVQAELLSPSTEQVGIDLGLQHLAATSDGETIDPPKHLRRSERKLKQCQRKVSRKSIGSKRRKKAVLLLARLHEKVANQRKDHAHKKSRKLVNRYGFLAFEKLHVQGMIQNRHLAKSIADASWSQFVQFIAYKAERAGRMVVQVDPRNTSRDCSNCTRPVKKSLAVRVHRCHHCGYVADRDFNAARNILQRALAS